MTTLTLVCDPTSTATSTERDQTTSRRSNHQQPRPQHDSPQVDSSQMGGRGPASPGRSSSPTAEAAGSGSTSIGLVPRVGDADAAARALIGQAAAITLETLQGRRRIRLLGSMFHDEALHMLSAWHSVPAWFNARLGSVRASALSRRHVEGCVRIDTTDGPVMVTLRMERQHQGWVCVRLDVLATDGHLAQWGVAA